MKEVFQWILSLLLIGALLLSVFLVLFFGFETKATFILLIILTAKLYEPE